MNHPGMNMGCEQYRFNDTLDLVPDEWGCPWCGERRIDWLLCDGDDVLCATCNRTYSLEFGLAVEAEV